MTAAKRSSQSGLILPTQSTNHLLLVKPARFFSNPQTMASNSFQNAVSANSDPQDVTTEAHAEFDHMVQLLLDHGVSVTVAKGAEGSPDSIFPNNLFSTHADGVAVLYPMYAENRHAELTKPLLTFLQEHYEVRDFRYLREKQEYLEGTGSLVLDRVNRIAYAGLSPRTTQAAAQTWADQMGYKLVLFNAYDREGVPVYHTNVVMFIGTDIVSICKDNIAPEDRDAVMKSIKDTGREIVPFDKEQFDNMCGNGLEVVNLEGAKLLVMSDRAYYALTTPQLHVFKEHYDSIIHTDLRIIEMHGGGSARCMLAEIFPAPAAR